MKKPKLDKAPKEPKAPKAKRTEVAGSNTLDPEKRALFLKDKGDYAKAKDRLAKAQSAVRLIGKTIKADGFSMRQIKLAIQLESPEGEAEFRSLIANDLLAAQYQGAEIGSQLQLFLEDKDRTPAEDRAYDEGQKCSIENRAARPPYDPGTPQHQKFMAGFHDHQARIAKGIGKQDRRFRNELTPFVWQPHRTISGPVASIPDNATGPLSSYCAAKIKGYCNMQ